MLPSTRVCVAANCQAASRIISSIKELDNHKGHSSSSIGQVQAKLKSLSVDPSDPLSKLIISKCEIMREMINKRQQQLLNQIKPFELIETVQVFLSSNFACLQESMIDLVITNLTSIDKQVAAMHSDYAALKAQIQSSLDKDILNLIKLFSKKQVKSTTSGSKLQTIQEQSPIRASSQTTLSFLPHPVTYESVTKVVLDNDYKTAKHVDGCYTMVLLNQIIDPNSTASLDLKIISIQEGYVGVGIGLVLKSRIATKGLILQFEEMQKIGHGIYMMFNDKCIICKSYRSRCIQSYSRRTQRN